MDVFDYDDYKEFLNDYLDDKASGGRGARAKLSAAIPCKTSYTAQVLKGIAHFSLEQGEAITEYLNLTQEEGHFLLLLIQNQRAGTVRLRERIRKQISDIKAARTLLKNRLGVKQAIPEEMSAQFYSSWYYSAIHALVSIPGFQTPELISQRLGVPKLNTSEALKLLCDIGLLNKLKSGYEIGHARIHLGSDSPLISKHHTNWRMQSIRSLDFMRPEDLHYSSVISISAKDASLIREQMMKFLKSLDPVISASKEEKLYSIGLDFFEM